MVPRLFLKLQFIQTLVSCLSPSVGICAAVTFGWVLQKGAVTRHPKFQVTFCYESVIKVLVV